MLTSNVDTLALIDKSLSDTSGRTLISREEIGDILLDIRSIVMEMDNSGSKQS